MPSGAALERILGRMSTYQVEAKGLTHRYGERLALAEVTFTIGAAEIFGFLGPNGGGKTTLFRLLATLIPPGGGEATVLGFDLASQPDAIRRLIGVVFQSPSLDGKLTVTENLLHQGHLYGLHGRELETRRRDMLERLGLAERSRDRAEILSGGLRRRVEIAKGLLHRPRLLLLDEPSTGLDPGARRDLWDLLQELRERDGVTILLTTHLMEEAERCDRVGILDRGRLVALGTPAGLCQEIGGDMITVVARDPESLRTEIERLFGGHPTVLNGTIRLERPRAHEFIPRLMEAWPGRIDSVTVGRPTHEDVFIQRTGHHFWDGAPHAGIGEGSGDDH